MNLTCPYCDRPNEIATTIAGNRSDTPKPGDLIICGGCVLPAILRDGELCPLTAAEVDTAGMDARYQALVSSVIDAHLQHLFDPEPT